jgi:hypothetical protein
MRYLYTLVGLTLATAAAQGWNDKGHMVVAHLAWKELTVEERAKVVQFLQRHPHYAEYLKHDRPDNIPEDEWVFMRAGTWADWIRGGPPERRKYNEPTWHYINFPLVPAGSNVKPPELPATHVVKQIPASKEIAKLGGSQEERAIHICWVFHLIGDIHQPMHTITLFSKEFPDGDRGGNRSLLRINGRVIQMHSFWDNLLGEAVTLSSIGSTVLDVEKALQEHASEIESDLKANQTSEAWAKEGFALAKRHAYRNGELLPANIDTKPAKDVIPEVTEAYAKNAGHVARLGAGKAGKRLAVVLREILAAN